MKLSKKLKHLAAVVATLAALTSLHAVTVSFSFTGGAGSGSIGNSLPFSSSPAGVTVSVTAWSNDGSSSNVFTAGAVGQYSGGLGVYNNLSTDSSHTVDNSGRRDYLVFSFSPSIDINSVSIGYVESASNGYGDSDFNYWIGNSLASVLQGSGGTAVNGGSGPGTYVINGGNVFGTYIAISAGLLGSNDGFKVSGMSVDYTVTNIPPPNVPDQGSTLVLIGMGMVGMVALKKRSRA